MWRGFKATARSRFLTASSQVARLMNPAPNSILAKKRVKPESRFTSACQAPRMW